MRKTGVLCAVAAASALALLVCARREGPTALLEAVSACPTRTIESRVSGGFPHRPLDPLRGKDAPNDWRILAAVAQERERAQHDASIENARINGVATLLGGSEADAARLLESAVERQTEEPALFAAIRRSRDAVLLNDLAAAELERNRRHSESEALLVAIEAADRSWSLKQTPESSWNRALAVERLGVSRAAARAWRDYFNVETSLDWKAEAAARIRLMQQRVHAARPDPELLATGTASESLQLIPLQDAQQFFEKQLLAAGDDRAQLKRLRRIGARISDLFGDRLASDTAESLARSHASSEGIRAYARGRADFDAGEVERARGELVAAESALAKERNPFALAAEVQLIRCECTQGDVTACVSRIRAFERRVEASGRYPWLQARGAAIEGQALWNSGRIYDAVLSFRRALSESERLHDTAGTASLHAQLASALATAGESDAALDHNLTSLRWSSWPEDDRRRQIFETSTLVFLRRDALAAARLLVEGLSATPATDESRVSELVLKGLLQTRLRDAGATTSLQRARALLSRTAPGDRERLAAVLEIAEVGARRSLGPADSAEKLTGVMARYETIAESVWLPQLLTERGAAFERQGDDGAAEADYLRAMAILEGRQPRIDELMIGADLSAEAETAFDRRIRLLLRQQRIAAALDTVERMNTLHISSVFAENSGLRDAYRVAESRPSLNAAATAQRVLGADERIVVYYLSHDTLITWLVSRSDIVAYRRTVRGAELAAAVQRLPDGGESERVSSMLLSPWIDRVAPGATIIFVPPPQLGAIPFAQLTHGGRPLISRNAVAASTNLKTFIDATSIDRRRSAPSSALFAAAGRPHGDLSPLPLAEQEARMAVRNYRDGLLLGEATRGQFLASANRYAVIHFAGHALVNDRQPLLSALVFDDELLYVHELLPGAFSHARLVVLSACGTGHEPRPTMSIATALLRQGIPSVVYTLWPVADEAAAFFSQAFHRSLAAGSSRAQAVRDAQLEMLRSPTNVSNPRAWAAFQISGAPGPLAVAREGEKR